MIDIFSCIRSNKIQGPESHKYFKNLDEIDKTILKLLWKYKQRDDHWETLKKAKTFENYLYEYIAWKDELFVYDSFEKILEKMNKWC